MTTLLQDIQDKFRRANVFEKIIAINVVVFVVGFILARIARIGLPFRWLSLPRDGFDALMQPWSILSYGFVHYDFWHILFNMLILYMVARIMLNLFSVKMSLNIYFLGIIFGGLAFLLVYNIIPLRYLKPAGFLVGASAGVRALLIFLSAYLPNQEVRIFTFNVKLMYIGLVLVGLDVLGLFGLNQGGNVAHLGGAFLGYLYAVQLQKGNDIGKGFERLMDVISNLFKPREKNNLKTVHKRTSKSKSRVAGHKSSEFNEFNKQKQIDLILDKISKSGYDSLSQAEKEFLFKAGKE